MKAELRPHASFRAIPLWLACALSLTVAGAANAQLTSYATSATDIVGSTGAPAVALGVPDYRFVNDSGLGFGGTSTDVFDPGETVELAFPTPLRNNALQDDLLVSAFVGGLGATDNATVQVEASTDGVSFSIIDTFDTQDARSVPPPDQWENDFEAVKHLSIDFGALDGVTHIRLTNLGGTSEGLRLDAVEGLYPTVASDRAFEVRISRVREEIARRFTIRIKNTSQPGGVAIREWIMDRTASTAALQQTGWTIDGEDGQFICVENCIPDNHPTLIPFSRHVWSVDGSTEAPVGVGLEPGLQAEQPRSISFDTDNGATYLENFQFTVVFTDGFAHTFEYETDVLKEIGSLYQQYLYFSSTPAQSWNRPVDYYEFAQLAPSPAVPSMSPSMLILLSLLAAGAGATQLRRRNASDASDASDA